MTQSTHAWTPTDIFAQEIGGSTLAYAVREARDDICLEVRTSYLSVVLDEEDVFFVCWSKS